MSLKSLYRHPGTINQKCKPYNWNRNTSLAPLQSTPLSIPTKFCDHPFIPAVCRCRNKWQNDSERPQTLTGQQVELANTDDCLFLVCSHIQTKPASRKNSWHWHQLDVWLDHASRQGLKWVVSLKSLYSHRGAMNQKCKSYDWDWNSPRVRLQSTPLSILTEYCY